MKRLIVILLLAALGLGVTSVWILTRFYDPTPGPHKAVELVPRDAILYAHLSLDPSNVQKKAFRRVASRFLPDASFEDVKDSVGRLLDPVLSGFGMSYGGDVEPWLGDEVGVFAAGAPEGDALTSISLLLATEDEDAARRAVRQVVLRATGSTGTDVETYRGVEYEVVTDGSPNDTTALAVLDGFVVVGSHDGIRDAIDASAADPLEGENDYAELREPLNEDHLVQVYVDADAIQEAPDDRRIDPFVDALDFQAGGGIGIFSVRVEGQGIVLEASSRAPDGPLGRLSAAFEGESPIESAPADAWAVVGAGDVGALIQGALDIVRLGSDPDLDLAGDPERLLGLDLRIDVIPWAGDAYLFLVGDSLPTVGGGIVVGSDDPAATRAAVDRVAAHLAERSSSLSIPVRIDGLEGFEIRGLAPAPVTLLGGERMIVSYGGIAANEAVAPDETLERTESFRRARSALGEGVEPILFADLARIRDLIAPLLPVPLRSTYEKDMERFVAPLSYAVAGVDRREDVLFQRLIVGVE